MARRLLCIFLTILTLFLTGTVIVLTTVVQYFGVDARDVITEKEMNFYMALAESDAVREGSTVVGNAGQKVVVEPVRVALEEDEDVGMPEVARVQAEGKGKELRRRSVTSRQVKGQEAVSGSERKQRVPKIVHQTWKEDVLPVRWDGVRKSCIAMHPDYEFKLWTDASSREFIYKEYPWFLSTYDGYPYPIQRADAIRYFVLHYYGGVYMDLDVGCKLKLDPLLYFEVVLPATIPVGVSNDIMVAQKNHPFMDLVIHNLITFDHQYGTNYPTVMFSTGPMFLSAQYGLWPKEDGPVGVERQVRILPRMYYGKNAPMEEQGTAFFEHFYGSSWHADDAGFVTFLGNFGVPLMYIGLVIVICGMIRLVWPKRFKTRASGAIALPFHAEVLPFVRPGTPSSRPPSPFGRYARDDHSPPSPKSDLRSFLPSWILGSSASRQHSPKPSWSNHSKDSNDISYQPVSQPYSRPQSPTDSILKASGSHDGAFDGVHLNSLPSSSTSSPNTSPSGLPTYASLKDWRDRSFRNDFRQQEQDLERHRQQGQPPPPFSSQSRTGSPSTRSQQHFLHHPSADFPAAGHYSSLPSPPYSVSNTAAAAFAFTNTTSGSRSSAPPTSPHPSSQYSRNGSLYSPGLDVTFSHSTSRIHSRRRSASSNGSATSHADTRSGSSTPAHATTSEKTSSFDGHGQIYEQDLVGVEEEVDRLLNEMDPEVERRKSEEEKS